MLEVALVCMTLLIILLLSRTARHERDLSTLFDEMNAMRRENAELRAGLWQQGLWNHPTPPTDAATRSALNRLH